MKETEFGFEIEIDKDEVRVLQFTDTQIIDASQRRFPERLTPPEIERWDPSKVDQNLFGIMDRVVARVKPDIIIFTGDNVYGSFDDSGRQVDNFISHVESYKIPWAIVFGNHDNETIIPMGEQKRKYKDAKFSIFTDAELEHGNSNYAITITRSGVPVRTLIMLDTNACFAGTDPRISKIVGFGADQMKFALDVAKTNNKRAGTIVPISMYYHVPDMDFEVALVSAGYQQAVYSQGENHQYTYKICETADPKPGDFGAKHNELIGCWTIDEKFKLKMIEMGLDSVFAGHWHTSNFSVKGADGVRYTMGLKTGTYDSHNPDELGGTLAMYKTDGSGTLHVQHIYELQQ